MVLQDVAKACVCPNCRDSVSLATTLQLPSLDEGWEIVASETKILPGWRVYADSQIDEGCTFTLLQENPRANRVTIGKGQTGSSRASSPFLRTTLVRQCQECLTLSFGTSEKST